MPTDLMKPWPLSTDDAAKMRRIAKQTGILLELSTPPKAEQQNPPDNDPKKYEKCEQGQTAAQTGCEPADGHSSGSHSESFLNQVKDFGGDLRKSLHDSGKRKKVGLLAVSGLASLARLVLQSTSTQVVKDVAAVVKTASNLKIVGKGLSALAGKQNWGKKDGEKLRRALYDLPAIAITHTVNYTVPTFVLFPILYKTPGVKDWFPSELVDPSDDKVTEFMSKLEGYLSIPEQWLRGEAAKYMREPGWIPNESGARFLADVIELVKQDLEKLKASK